MKKGTFKYKDRAYELARIESLTFEEALDAQRISGMPVGELLIRAAANDASAWLAIFAVSIRRVDPDFNEFELGGENFVDLIESVKEVREPPPGSEDEPRSDEASAKAADNSSTNVGAGNGAADSSSAQAASLDGKGSSLSSETTPEPHGSPA